LTSPVVDVRRGDRQTSNTSETTASWAAAWQRARRSRILGQQSSAASGQGATNARRSPSHRAGRRRFNQPITVLFRHDRAFKFNTNQASNTKRTNIGTAYRTTCQPRGGQSGVMYACRSFPVARRSLPATGVINWTPTAAQPGEKQFYQSTPDRLRGPNVTYRIVSPSPSAGEPLAAQTEGRPQRQRDQPRSMSRSVLAQPVRPPEQRHGQARRDLRAYADVVFDGDRSFRCRPGAHNRSIRSRSATPASGNHQHRIARRTRRRQAAHDSEATKPKR